MAASPLRVKYACCHLIQLIEWMMMVIMMMIIMKMMKKYWSGWWLHIPQELLYSCAPLVQMGFQEKLTTDKTRLKNAGTHGLDPFKIYFSFVFFSFIFLFNEKYYIWAVHDPTFMNFWYEVVKVLLTYGLGLRPWLTAIKPGHTDQSCEKISFGRIDVEMMRSLHP